MRVVGSSPRIGGLENRSTEPGVGSGVGMLRPGREGAFGYAAAARAYRARARASVSRSMNGC